MTSRPRSSSAIDLELALKEADRCLNCDVQTVFTGQLCIECDACVDICPMDCMTFTANGEEADLRSRLQAPANNLSQDLYIGNSLKTGRIMAKDEDVACIAGCAPSAAPPARGHAEEPHRYDLRRTSMPIESVNDFVVRSQRQRLRLRQRHELFARFNIRRG